jgi:hypothetical protein
MIPFSGCMHRVHCVLDVLLSLDTREGSTQTIPGKSYCRSGIP